METHRQDGMAFALNVGNYHAPRDGSWPPLEFPQHENKIPSTNQKEPNCDCYVDDYALES